MTPDLSPRIAFREGVEVLPEDSFMHVRHAMAAFRLRGVPPRLQATLHRLVGERVTCDPELEWLCAQLSPLVTSFLVDAEDRPVLSIERLTRTARFAPAPLPAGTRVRLSRFAMSRLHQGDLVLESPLSMLRVRWHSDEAWRFMVGLSAGRAASGVTDAFIHAAGLLEVDIGSGFHESDVLRQWEFHDLLFHSRSRLGRHGEPFGATYPFKGEIPPRPAMKQPPAGPVVELPEPDLDAVSEHDPAFTAVLEQRRSIREYGQRPLRVDQVAEFLYRVARVRSLSKVEGLPYQASSRPYPSGGAAYDLELYLLVERCDGLARGIYHYDPLDHRLTGIEARPADLARILGNARSAAGLARSPDVMFVITSRFQRLAWKYRGLAYAATLKNVGVLYQTMYLVATAMGLAPCALGSGDSDLSARVLGLDYLEESAVGEFMLGSRPS
ncbi:SagB family peptide dehydrogenase [Nonomuraea sp. NPDC050536]|uniref:SagB family peptide dehydrogenase n=1 Tax=Nonomuraea sp. NPDC050536 TaxID=3364366 RepID=UPI0037C85643